MKGILLLCLLFALAVGQPASPARHVVVIGLDGARPELVREHSTGSLRTLVTEGASTWNAQAAIPTVTQVNFAGILTSSLPQKHGIEQIAWDHANIPKVKTTTIFEVLAAHDRTGVAFLGHEKLYPSETPARGVHFEHSPHGARAAAPLAARFLREHQPAFAFVYLGDLDGAGHRSGWLSTEQIAAMKEINDGVDLIVAAVRESAMRDNTVIIVTSDHGGHGKSHSQGSPDDRTIPWLAWGAGVRRGHELSGPVFNHDTAATALFILGLPIPPAWDGKPVTGAFSSAE